MSKYLVLKSAKHRLDEIYQYTLEAWSEQQADAYINGLFTTFERIVDKDIVWRTIPAEFGVSGYFTIYSKHYIYWKELKSGQIGIVSILHERMHQIEQFRREFEAL